MSEIQQDCIIFFFSAGIAEIVEAVEKDEDIHFPMSPLIKLRICFSFL